MLLDMSAQKKLNLSIVVPVYNEASGLVHFHNELTAVLREADLYDDTEIIYCDDGSKDDTKLILDALARKDSHVKTIIFSRNFGKESALTAGISSAIGDAILTIDGDEQHPVELIPTFVDLWKNGAKIVIGVRERTENSWLHKLESKAFYSIFNRLSSQKLVPGSTDFRLIDRSVQKPFVQLMESNRMTRALIDWLGFKQQYVSFTPKKRQQGKPSYSRAKLIRLALDSIVSISPRPLYLLGYLGMFVTGLSFILGVAVFFEQILLHDPLHWRFTGTAMLGILMLFFIGIILISQGVLAVYISHIHTESKKRPLYIIDEEQSKSSQNI
jgi:glycosyltransferase involved in cell wall biosynthesis